MNRPGAVNRSTNTHRNKRTHQHVETQHQHQRRATTFYPATLPSILNQIITYITQTFFLDSRVLVNIDARHIRLHTRPLSIIESLTASNAAIRTELQLVEAAIERTLLQDIVLPRPPSGKIYVQNRTLEKNFESIRRSQEELRKLLSELAGMRGRREQGVLGAFDILSRDGGQLLEEARTGREERGREILR